MDKNGRLFGKISIIDLFVVLLIIAIAAGIVFRFGFSGSVARNDESTIAYTVKINRVRQFTLDYHLQGIGSRVYDRFSGNPIGVVTAVRYESYFENHRMPDGSIVNVELPGFLTIYVDIETRGFTTDRAIFTEESFELRVGGTLGLWFRYVNVNGSVINIDVIE